MKRIEIIDPRRVTVSLPCTKKGSAYQVATSLCSFLEGRGWTLQKTTKLYATMTPKDGTKAPFVFNVEIPNRDQVVAVAKEMHAVQNPWVGKFGEWVAYYEPPTSTRSRKFDPFTAQAISEWKQGGIIPAVFFVGVRLFWCADVTFQAGGANYYESESEPIQSQAAASLVSPDEIPSSIPLVEGATCRITVNAYERNPEARRQCIEAHGTRCCICKFSFGAVYGPEAEGYIHAHHVKPLSEIGAAYVVDPINDMRPVCPNCHAVLHLSGRCRTIEEVRQLWKRGSPS